MKDFEKLGVFYLGRESDPSGQTLGDVVLYDSRHLLTHAVCMGMTGSGKTGLCVSLIEEAAIDGVPAIAIDPKGDLANLLLTFPALSAADFRPWIDEDEARRAGVAPDAFAAQQAETWKKGLAEWGQDGARLERLRAAAEFAVYTPGSRIARPLSIVSTFSAPPPATRDDEEALADRASTTALSVLALAGVAAEARGREHTFMSTLLAESWKAGKDLDLAGIITGVQTPPFDRIGVLDVESFYPSKERFALTTKLNAVLASPGFAQWLEGDPLDAGRLLYGATGKPRVSIVSIAHLDDERRMFVVSLLLNEIVAWMRRQSGTSSLRAIVYMDEIAGYFPPVAVPPSKAPLLTLLKQARAFGIGVVLASQNTVDLDYKALGNAGTWFLGRLQTERDKARVLDGLEGAAAGSIDRSAADTTLSALGKRVFLLHDVHAGAPQTFMTRWALSYLRGPLSRDQLRALVAAEPTAPGVRTGSDAGQSGVKPGSDQGQTTSRARSSTQPVLPPGVNQYFIPATAPSPRYVAVALGIAKVTFGDTKLKISETRDVVAAAPIGDGAVAVDWDTAEILDVAPADLESAPADDATFRDPPRAAVSAKNYAAWQKGFASWLASGQTLELLRHAASKLTAASGESERDFRIRVQNAQREARDAEVDTIRRKFAEKRARFEAALRRAEQGVQRETDQASQAKLQTAVSLGATVLGALLGRKTISASNLGRATTTMRGAGRAYKESEDIARAQQNVADAKKKLEELDAQIAEETAGIAARYDAEAGNLETISLTPKRGQIVVQAVALGWKAG
jgi:DNA helicase HerA-like ATPase